MKAFRFSAAVRERASAVQSWLCVGLDPDPARLPHGVSATPDSIVDFCREIIGATQHAAAAFKVNFAFFEGLGADGWTALERVRREIPEGFPVIADAKRGDIGNTARAYARSILELLDFGAVTVSPYLGWDALEPFLEHSGRTLLVLCKTSNPGAGALQDLTVNGEPLYLAVARGALALSAPAEVGLVIGATYPEALRRVRDLNQDALFLVPGVGVQGARAADAIAAGANRLGDNALIAVSREVMFASQGDDYRAAARRAAESLAVETWQGRSAARAHR